MGSFIMCICHKSPQSVGKTCAIIMICLFSLTDPGCVPPFVLTLMCCKSLLLFCLFIICCVLSCLQSLSEILYVRFRFYYKLTNINTHELQDNYRNIKENFLSVFFHTSFILSITVEWDMTKAQQKQAQIQFNKESKVKFDKKKGIPTL